MTNTLHLKPSGADRLVRDPERPAMTLAAEGGLVPDTSYWRRRLAQGDVEIVGGEIVGGEIVPEEGR